MLNMAYIMAAMAGNITARHINFPTDALERVRLLNDPSFIDEDTLYIAARGLDLSALPDGKRCTLMLARGTRDISQYTGMKTLNIIETDLELTELFNRVMDVVERFDIWISNLETAMYKNRDMDELINLGASMLGAHVFLLNVGFKVVASNTDVQIDNPYSEELIECGYQKFKTVREITTDAKILRADTPEFRMMKWAELRLPRTDRLYFAYFIKFRGSVIARLNIIFPFSEPDEVFTCLATEFCRRVELLFLETQKDRMIDRIKYDALIADLIECRIKSQEELNDRLALSAVSVKKYYYCIVIECEDCERKPNRRQIYGELDMLFPGCLLTTYRNNIVMLVFRSKDSEPLEYDREAFNGLLECYKAYACIANRSRFLLALPDTYRQATAGIRFGKIFCTEKGNRIFRYEDYSMYHIVQICEEDRRACFNDDNLIHLCHPGIIWLLRYDLVNNTNMREVAVCYLKNNRNCTLTAAMLNLHRNTLLYKIQKIEDLLGESLNNPELQQRLLFSNTVVENILKVQQSNPLSFDNHFTAL